MIRHILLFLVCFSFYYNAHSEEHNSSLFLKQLEEINIKNNGFFPAPIISPVRSDKNKSLLENYLKKHSEKLNISINDILQHIGKTKYYEGIIKKHTKNNTPLSSGQIFSFFKKIEKEKLSFQNGDIILTLPATNPAVIFAYLSSSAYEHIDIIKIDKQGIPVVLELSRRHDIQTIPLARYLNGTKAPLTRFAIYRLKKQYRHELPGNILISGLLNKLEKKIIYDPLYIITPLRLEDINQQPYFMYCSEFAYNISKILLGKDFGKDKFISWLAMAEKGDPLLKETIYYLYKTNILSENEGIIRPEYFSESIYFEKVISMGDSSKL